MWKSLTVCSSAKDQLTGQAVAVKKIMKPLSTPVLSKRTYRELKLLKHLKHENVRLDRLSTTDTANHGLRANTLALYRSSALATFSYRHWRTCMLVSFFGPRMMLIHLSQLLRHRIARHRSTSPTHLAPSREAVHPVLLIPDPGKSASREPAIALFMSTAKISRLMTE